MNTFGKRMIVFGGKSPGNVHFDDLHICDAGYKTVKCRCRFFHVTESLQVTEMKEVIVLSFEKYYYYGCL